MTDVVVPTPELDSPAARALRMEQPEPWSSHVVRLGADLMEVECPDPLDYGKLFARLWDRGETFVIVEWDIVPWPGAVGDLLSCPEPWCTHRYPLHRGNVCLSFGIGKYVPTGPAPEHWATTPWHQLDGQVVPHLNKLFGHSHVHEPPVAHARREAA